MEAVRFSGNETAQVKPSARNGLYVETEQSIALDRAGMTDFRDTVFLAAGPASERVVRLQRELCENWT